jgi:Arc/MetJ family transcription regulator
LSLLQLQAGAARRGTLGLRSSRSELARPTRTRRVRPARPAELGGSAALALEAPSGAVFTTQVCIMSARGDVADDDFKRRAMEAYKAKGKGATVQAAAKMKVGAANTRRAMERSDSESSLSSESELSDE